MTLRRVGFITTLITLALLWPNSFLHAKNFFTVTSVYDGDTISCQGYGIIFRVRLAAIDAPERGTKRRPEQPYADKARNYLKTLILGKTVTIKQIALDRRNHILGIVYLKRKSGFFSSSRQNINLELVKQGYAEVKPLKYTFDMRPYRQAEKKAKAKKLNMWSQKDYVSPSEWRKKR